MSAAWISAAAAAGLFVITVIAVAGWGRAVHANEGLAAANQRLTGDAEAWQDRYYAAQDDVDDLAVQLDAAEQMLTRDLRALPGTTSDHTPGKD
jgi:hypothetical protein